MSDRVELHANAWLYGNHAAGPIAAGLFLPDSVKSDRFIDYLWAENAVIEMVQEQARSLRADDVVGYVPTLDPFAERAGRSGLAVSVTGTAVRR